MQDLTQGSLARNVLKMSSFMLVSMVFQTLYFLVDLYFVGRLGRDAVAAVSISGNLTFLVLAATQTLGVGTTALIAHAVGRKDRDEARLLFNQSQALSLLVGVLFLVVMMALRDALRPGAGRRRRRPPAWRSSTWPGSSRRWPCSSRWWRPARLCAGTGNFKPGMVIQSATVVLNTVLAPRPDPGLGHRPAARRGRRRDRLADRHLRGRRGAPPRTSCASRSYLRSCWRELPAAAGAVGPHAQDRPAGGGGVRADGRLHDGDLHREPAVRRRRPRPASASALRVVQAGFMPVVALGFAVSPVAGPELRRPPAPTGCGRRSGWGPCMACGFMLALTAGLPARCPRR